MLKPSEKTKLIRIMVLKCNKINDLFSFDLENKYNQDVLYLTLFSIRSNVGIV